MALSVALRRLFRSGASQGVINFDTEIANGALDLRLAQQQLDCPEYPTSFKPSHKFCKTLLKNGT